MKIYNELAGWFHLLTAPEDYAEEAAVYLGLMETRAERPVRRVLELGSGGGNNASHMKKTLELTLADLSRPMLELSATLNPECEHVRGDMRNLRLGRTFDAVFVHDAVMYMTTEKDLRATMATAVTHCRPGGLVLFVPDCVAETFREYENDGGHDGEDGRSLRYHEIFTDPDPTDTTYEMNMTIRLREAGGTERVETDAHTLGLFSKRDWMAWMRAAGLQRIEAVPIDLGDPGSPPGYVFMGVGSTV